MSLSAVTVPPIRPEGSLVIVGTGIAAIAQMTVEAIAQIRAADAVFYSVPDGVTAAYIQSLNPTALDLARFYGEQKRRKITYMQMAESMLRPLRAGKHVVGVFYGHPGFFVFPARRALAIARKEGFFATMLPGVSSLDCLFADLNIDPGALGCQILEATDLLIRNRPVTVNSHVIILQVASVGDIAISLAGGFSNARPPVLYEKLIELYGPDHPGFVYLAASFPGTAPLIQRRPLSAYLDPAVLKTIPQAATFYLPPKGALPLIEEMVQRLGMRGPVAEGPAPGGLADYGPFERNAIALMESGGGPQRHYVPQTASPALHNCISLLATDAGALRRYRIDPRGFSAGISGLNAVEVAALSSRQSSRLRVAAANPETVNPDKDKPTPA